MQGPTEAFDHFLMALKTLSRSCEYGPVTESVIKYEIIDGVQNEILRERLLRINDLTLHRAVEVCWTAELSKAQVRSPATETHLHAIGSKDYKPAKATGYNGYRQGSDGTRNGNSQRSPPSQRCESHTEVGKEDAHVKSVVVSTCLDDARPSEKTVTTAVVNITLQHAAR